MRYSKGHKWLSNNCPLLSNDKLGDLQFFSNVGYDTATAASLAVYVTSGSCRTSFNLKFQQQFYLFQDECMLPCPVSV